MAIRGENLPEQRKQQANQQIVPFDAFDEMSRGYDLLAGSPWQVMRRMQETMDRMFDQFVGGGTLVPTSTVRGGVGLTPLRMDVSETDKEVCIDIDLPGYKPNEVEIELDQDQLVISAKHEEEREVQDRERQYLRRERRLGSFRHSLSVPTTVEGEKIDASFRDGVLSIVMPKQASAQKQVKRIPVHNGASKGQQAHQPKEQK